MPPRDFASSQNPCGGNKQLLDEIFVISGMIKVEVSVITQSADNTYRDLDYFGYH